MQGVTAQGEASTMCDERDQQTQHQQEMNLNQDEQQQYPHNQYYPHQHYAATTAFHVSKPSHALSAIITPPALSNTSIILGDDYFHVSRIVENIQVTTTTS
ncbi:hypothetical protein Hanom_Chr03g00180501 [Helianthus anomalus]